MTVSAGQEQFLSRQAGMDRAEDPFIPVGSRRGLDMGDHMLLKKSPQNSSVERDACCPHQRACSASYQEIDRYSKKCKYTPNSSQIEEHVAPPLGRDDDPDHAFLASV